MEFVIITLGETNLVSEYYQNTVSAKGIAIAYVSWVCQSVLGANSDYTVKTLCQKISNG